MSTILNEFLQDEDTALLEQRQGEYYPDNHHRIKPEFKKIFKNLDPPVLQKYYYHSLRIGNFPFEVSLETWPSLIKAVEQIAKYLSSNTGYSICCFTRFEALLIFGIDGVTVSALDSKLDLQTYNERLAIYKKAQQYSHIPGMLDKLGKLHEFTKSESLVKHIHFVLRQSVFTHNGVSASNFLFWTMVAIIMHKNDTESKVTLELFKKAEIPEKLKHFEIYQRFETAFSKLN